MLRLLTRFAGGRLVLAATVIAVLGLGAALGSGPAAAQEGPVVLRVDSPLGNPTVTGPLLVSGWAADPRIPSGTGIDRVEVYLDGPPNQGRSLGTATYGISRPDVAQALQNPRFTDTGFRLQVDPTLLTSGPHQLVVVAVSTDGSTATATADFVYSAQPMPPPLPAPLPPPPSLP